MAGVRLTLLLQIGCKAWSVVAWEVQRITSGWMIRGYNPVRESGFLSFGARPGPPWSPTSLIKRVMQLSLEVKALGRAFGHLLRP